MTKQINVWPKFPLLNPTKRKLGCKKVGVYLVSLHAPKLVWLSKNLNANERMSELIGGWKARKGLRFLSV